MKKLNKKQRLIILIAIITIIIVVGIAIGANAIRVNIANGEYNSSYSSSNNQNLLPEYIKKGITLLGVTGTLESLDTSDATAKPEDIAYGKTAYVNGKKITGLFVPRDNLKVGDYVSYRPDEAEDYLLLATDCGYTSDQTIHQENLKWRIMSINDDGTIDLISTTATDTSIYFIGAKSYNNGVFLLNDIAKKLYSNTKMKIFARSINMEDIEKHMTQEGLSQAHSYVSASGAKYGTTKRYTGSVSHYPNLYELENGSGINSTSIKKDGIGQSESYYTEPSKDTPGYKMANNGLTVTQTGYKVTMNSDYYIEGNDYYNLIHNNGNPYWVATRSVFSFLYSTDFGINHIKDNTIDGSSLFGSTGGGIQGKFGLRPVITINSYIKLGDGDGSEESPYQILN